jgi:hypothetical protein
MKARAAWVGGALVLAVAGIQLVPVERSNPPMETEVAAPPAARAVLRRACYDCHSHETRWPWYAQVAPVSWLVANDVQEGRRELNFSQWQRRDARRQAKATHEVWEQVSKGTMPPWYYTPLHPEARLSVEDREALRAWRAEVTFLRATGNPGGGG